MWSNAVSSPEGVHFLQHPVNDNAHYYEDFSFSRFTAMHRLYIPCIFTSEHWNLEPHPSKGL